MFPAKFENSLFSEESSEFCYVPRILGRGEIPLKFRSDYVVMGACKRCGDERRDHGDNCPKWKDTKEENNGISLLLLSHTDSWKS